MTLAQSFKIYEILGKYFSNAEDAKIVGAEIEQIIVEKVQQENVGFATKANLKEIKEEILKEVVRLREESLQLQIAIERRFNQLTIWIVGTAIALTGVIIAVSRLK